MIGSKKQEAFNHRRACLVVHKEAIVEVKRIVGGVLNEVEQRLVTASVYARALNAHLTQHTAHCVGDELSVCCLLVVHFTRHLHHAAPLATEYLRIEARIVNVSQSQK
jgi:hypothetical protein